MNKLNSWQVLNENIDEEIIIQDENPKSLKELKILNQIVDGEINISQSSNNSIISPSNNSYEENNESNSWSNEKSMKNSWL